ncbi:palmitoyltransferase ZDHHC16 [Parasteatoda tepidariorum]|uniref:palmitoyltransferase ZDHHC16 n=1 Tax=Parasteatoda tepidariorum TaxID=114398 RepID=UPI00077F851C|nr:palmitoyltransferase ZDHHC16 [Parasteatoda tepidariorum]XP_015907513.1 palmitoyltransferase ZDHHC16 [Parasteatoda tepidariorum]
MVKVQCKIFSWCRYILQKVWIAYSVVKLIFLSLFYNEFADKYYIGDACMEPIFWLVDHFTKIIGPVCVIAVILLATSIIVVAYAVGLPFYLKQNVFILLFALFIGHWLLLNIMFYYYMACITDPGYPPQGTMITDAVSICKRCIAPKPPRTHHCIVCNRCILKMDHHCPWLNNCIGHFNHRYFFMFCVYTWIGVLFCIIFGIPIFRSHFWYNSEYSFSPHLINVIKTVADQISRQPRTLQETFEYNFRTNSTSLDDKWVSTLYHSCVVYAALLCFSVFCILGGLLAWHARLITNGETSIESHINKRERKNHIKEGKIYENPFDFGAINNWKIFLRIDYLGSWWHVLLPYTVAPAGNGIQWKLSNSEQPVFNYLDNDNKEACFIKMA